MKPIFSSADSPAPLPANSGHTGRRPRLVEPQGVRLPLLGHLSIQQQYAVSVSLLLLCLAIFAGCMLLNVRRSENIADSVAIATNMQMLTQRIAKAAQQAALGNREGFDQLLLSRKQFDTDLHELMDGNGQLPAPASGISHVLNNVSVQWNNVNGEINTILLQMDPVIAMGNHNNQLLNDAEQLDRLTRQTADLAQDEPHTTLLEQAALAAGRIDHDAATWLMSGRADNIVADMLAQNSRQIQQLLDAYISDTAAGPASTDLRHNIDQIHTILGRIEINARLRGTTGSAKVARQTAQAIFVDADALLFAVQEATAALQDQRGALYSLRLAAGVAAAGLLLAVAMLARVNIYEARMRAWQTERLNQRHQAAIDRLLNEIRPLADGYLSARATGSDEITGAIATGINQTIDALRGVVQGINDVTSQVITATRAAQDISVTLLDDAQTQSDVINATHNAVQEMSTSIREVAEHADESADVARRALEAARNGSSAVQDTIQGMNLIRDQIQETAKRIKRLGESSQEISAIVALISDLTEQTNVLALNAAIQATSAGEAGRGFSVVAEEVQRLAERSADATQQIGAIVRTIQTDTQDAVAAMERSTQGVAEGARRADTAGQALREIETVSADLFTLIEAILEAARQQAVSAHTAASSTQSILDLNVRTTQGTRQTAGSIEQLAALAGALRNSVAGFKLEDDR